MARALFLPLLLLAVGCGGGFFVARPSQTTKHPRVTVENESKGAIYVTFQREKKERRLDVPAFGEGTLELAPGTYDWQLFFQGRTGFKAKWFSHGPKGVVELERRTRYFHRYRPR
jgi:hypothetical protein